MPRYRASEAIYLSNECRLIAEGEIFASNETPGRAWIALDKAGPRAVAKATTSVAAAPGAPGRRMAAPARKLK